MDKNRITILCSGFGLGLYIPGLLLEKSLNEQGVATEICVFENLIPEDKKEKVLKSKKSYHNNFAVALMSTRIPIDMRQSLDTSLVDRLITAWEKEGRVNFIVLSGHWLHVLDEYKRRFPAKELNADILYVDCDLPPSWKSLKAVKPDYSCGINEIWLYDYEKKHIQFQIPITHKPPIPYAQRPDRFLIHGGGWGMGTYQGKIPELEGKGMQLDIVAYDMNETKLKREGNRYFMMDPSWAAWHKNIHNRFEYPPFCEIKDGEEPVYTNKEEYHTLFDITREARAIIGKPGAGTLMDSLGAATPLIMLEHFGDHEKKNTDLWEALGLGITYDKWKESGFSTQILEHLHNNLLEKRNKIDDLAYFYAEKA